MTNKTSTFELLATMFMFSMLLSSGIFYALGARYQLSIAWPVIPGIALALTGAMYWRVRARRGASQVFSRCFQIGTSGRLTEDNYLLI